jgi:DNA primase
MAGRIPDTFIDELRSRSDIVDVLSGYMHLTQKGSRFWGLCPFHSEKTPSFNVNADKQFFYCFGCHTGVCLLRF